MIDSTGFYELLAWLEANKKRVILAATGLVIMGSVIAVYRWKVAQTELAANDALLALRAPMNAPEKTPPPPASSFLKVANDFPSTSAAERALLLGAGNLFSEGKHQDAWTQFDTFLRRYGNHPLAVTAAYGKAASLEAQGKSDDALRDYQEVIRRYPNAALLDEARLGIARLHEFKKQPQLALQMYEEITRTNLMSAVSAEANTRKERLLDRHPELAKTNAPPASASSMAPTPSSATPPVMSNVGTNSTTAPTTNSGADLGTNAVAPSANAVPAAVSPKP